MHEIGIIENPPRHILCSECGESLRDFGSIDRDEWKMVMCYRDRLCKRIDLSRFAGLRLREIEDIMNKRQDALYELDSECFIYLPQQGGELVKKSRKYVAKEGDVGLFLVYHFAHFVCNRTRLTQEGCSYYANIFREAGFEKFRFEPITHGHFPSITAIEHWPWYRVHTEVGTIRIGHQATITNINWFDTGHCLPGLFENERVTSGDYEVHPTGEKQTIEFLKRIRQELTPVPA